MFKLKQLDRGKATLKLMLIASLLGNCVLLGRAWWTNWQSEIEISGMSNWVAKLQAHDDFRNGVKRQYELVSTDAPLRAQFTRRMDGPFEVWSWPYYPGLGHAHVLANQRFAETYNLKMRAMNKNPERFDPDSEGGQSDTTQPSPHPQRVVLVTHSNDREAAVGEHVRVEGVVANSKQPQIEGIDIETIYDTTDRNAPDLRGQSAWAEGILIRHVVTPDQVNNFSQNRGAGTFYELLDPNTGETAMAHPLTGDRHGP